MRGATERYGRWLTWSTRLGVALAVAALAAFAVVRSTEPSQPPTPPASGRSPDDGASPARRKPPGVPVNADRLQGPHLPSSAPVGVTIPALDVSTQLTRLDLAADGTLEVPEAAGDIGWFTGSATPGAVGPAVVAAHVTWGGRPAAFFELATLARGDRVLIDRRDGFRTEFAVTHVRRFPKSRFPTESVYGATDYAALRLITCGGRFDTVNRRYDDNVVVFGRLVSVHR